MDRLVFVVVCLLCVLDVVLVIIRFALFHGQKAAPGIETGKCMTIGAREVQEDSFAVVEAPAGTMGVLADGMGKHYGGKAAGRLAVETFTGMFGEYSAFDNPQYFFRRAFNAANREILGKLDEQRGRASVAAAIIQNGRLFYALVGDIKVAVYRGGDLIPASDGHTVDKLAEKRYGAGSLTRQDTLALLEQHRLYNYLGQDGFHDIELFDTPWPLRDGDIVVLMSNGLYECAAWRELEDVLAKDQSCEQAALELIELVNHSERADRDNASVILLKYNEQTSKKKRIL